MPPRLRLLIMLLMLLAMPLKGIAALGMAGCATSPAHVQGHQPTLQQATPCHEAPAADASASPADDCGGCAHCAACLAPLWAAPAAPASAVAALAHDWPVTEGTPVAGYSGAVPQPPPRR